MSRFCAYCGSAYQEDQKFCSNCGAPTQESQPQSAAPAPTYTPPQSFAPAGSLGVQAFPMNWYKFIIWFQLFASALMNAVMGLVAVTGTQYGGGAEQVYDLVPMLKPLDLIYGSLLVGSALLALVTRGRLRRFCKNGPVLYHILLGLQIVLPVFYQVVSGMVISSSILGGSYQPDYTSVISSMISSSVMLVCNIVYFNKRKAMFVN